MRVFIQTVSVILGLFVAGLLFLRFAPGFDLFMVRSGSMWPAISPGDLIVTGPINSLLTGEIEPGKIITYSRSDIFITHRVIQINGDVIVTKGDAVQTNDAWIVHTPEVVGIYLFKIPGVGYYTRFVKNPGSWFLIIILPAIILLWLLFREIFKNRRKISGDRLATGEPGETESLRKVSEEVSQPEKSTRSGRIRMLMFGSKRPRRTIPGKPTDKK